jgi:hypothetical protein
MKSLAVLSLVQFMSAVEIPYKGKCVKRGVLLHFFSKF